VDAEAAEASILAVVHEAEQQAGRTVREIVLGFSCGRLESVIKPVDLDLGGRAVAAADISHALALAKAQARRGRGFCAAGGDHRGRSPRLRDAAAVATAAITVHLCACQRGLQSPGGDRRCHLDRGGRLTRTLPASPAGEDEAFGPRARPGGGRHGIAHSPTASANWRACRSVRHGPRTWRSVCPPDALRRNA
jgi:hypothetical protein